MGAGVVDQDMRRIRLLTANVCNGQADPAALIALIEHLPVDVVCVQELRPRLARALSQALPNGQLGVACRRRRIAARVSLPATTLRFEFETHDQADVDAFIEHFDTHFRRGGG